MLRTYILIVFLTSFTQLHAQDSLEVDILKMDSLLFEGCFNNCDAELLEDIIAEDFEFYHDEGGINERADFISGFEKNICFSDDFKPIRKLQVGSTEVFPMKSGGIIYGAIQKGKHEFYIKEPEKEMYLTNLAEFVHLWILEEDQWKLKRVLSFDHKTP